MNALKYHSVYSDAATLFKKYFGDDELPGEKIENAEPHELDMVIPADQALMIADQIEEALLDFENNHYLDACFADCIRREVDPDTYGENDYSKAIEKFEQEYLNKEVAK